MPNPAEKPEVPTRVPKHGRGRLNVGGNHGGGRLRSEVRALLLGDALVAREKLIKRLDDTKECETCGRKMSDADVMRWFDLAAKYGIGAAKPGLDPALVAELSASVDQVLSDMEGGEAAKQAIYDRWAMTLGRYGAKE